MLTELKVKNFALIKNLTVHFGYGLNVITGETGAGKSLVLKSLNLLMGGKTSAGVVGSFGEEMIVEGLFELEGRLDVLDKLTNFSYTLDDNPFLVVRRVVSKKGKSRTYINGSHATLSDLREIVSPLVELSSGHEPLIELTSQHDHKNLQNPSYQRDLFDIFCKNQTLRQKMSSLIKELRAHESALADLKNSEPERLQKLDFLSFQLQELEQFQPKHSEYEELKNSVNSKEDHVKFLKALESSENILNDSDQSIVAQLYQLTDQFSDLSDHFSERLGSCLDNVNQCLDLAERAVEDVRKVRSQFSEQDQLSFEELQERLSTYEHLFRKYNTNSQGLEEIFSSLQQEKESLENTDDEIQNHEESIAKLVSDLEPLVDELSDSREQKCTPFMEGVNQSLSEMNMKGLEFKVRLSPQALNETGQESISFWLKHSKSNSEHSIKKTASGGELSRILLSIKSALGNTESPRTYLFDEIDSGVSGPTAEKVGKKLLTLSQGQQVITITHLPQVAALGDHHFLIEKTSGKEGHQTDLKPLNEGKRVEEVARLISGENITQTSLDHAAELMQY